MGSPARVAIVVGALTAVACSLLVDTSGLSDGTADASAPPVSTSTTDGKAPPTSDDASSPRSVDAASESGPSASVGCAGSTDFLCADFDDGPLAKGWSENRVSGGGTSALGDSFISPPHSFRATTPAGGAVERQSRLIADVPSLSPKRAVLSMQMMLCDATGSDFEIVKIEEATNGGGIKIFHSGQGRAEIDLRSRAPFSKAFSSPLPVGRWAHMVIDATYDRAAGSLVIAIDDAIVLEARDLPTFVDPLDGFMLGPWTDGPAQGCTEQFDDVRLRFEP